MKNLVQIIRNIVIKNDGMLILEARLCSFADSGVALHPSPLQKHFSPRVSGISSGDVITHNSSTSSLDEHFRILNCRLFNSENQSVNPFFDHLYQSNFYYIVLSLNPLQTSLPTYCCNLTSNGIFTACDQISRLCRIDHAIRKLCTFR